MDHVLCSFSPFCSLCCWFSAFSCGALAPITQLSQPVMVLVKKLHQDWATRGPIRPNLQMFWLMILSLVSNSRMRKETFFASGTFEGSIIWVENFGKWRSPSTFTRVSTHHLFLCEMFLASDALLGSTLDSKGLGGLWKQQTADEETSAPKVSLDDIDWSNTYNL